MNYMGFVLVFSILIPLVPTVLICILYGLCERISDGTMGGWFSGLHGVRNCSRDIKGSPKANSSGNGGFSHTVIDCYCEGEFADSSDYNCF